MNILYVENENNKGEISLKVKDINNSEIKEVIQYEYSDSLESLEQETKIYKICKVGDCRVESKWARLITNTEDLTIRIDDNLLEEFKQLNVYHIVKL